MRRHNLPVPPAFCITTDVGLRYQAEPAATIDADLGRRAGPVELAGRQHFAHVRPGPAPAVGQRALRGHPIDARHDGHHSERGHQRRRRTGPGQHAALTDFAHDTRRRFTAMYQRIVGGGSQPVPDDPYAQLRAAIEAVFNSWNSPRAIAYRAHYGLDDRAGTAVVVQAMVFGNQGPRSGAGAFFSRNPITEPTIRSASGCPVARATTWCRDWLTSNRLAPCATSNRRSTTSCATPPQLGAARVRRAGDRIHRRGRQIMAAADAGRGAFGAGGGATRAAAAPRRAHRRASRPCAG